MYSNDSCEAVNQTQVSEVALLALLLPTVTFILGSGSSGTPEARDHTGSDYTSDIYYPSPISTQAQELVASPGLVASRPSGGVHGVAGQRRNQPSGMSNVDGNRDSLLRDAPLTLAAAPIH